MYSRRSYYPRRRNYYRRRPYNRRTRYGYFGKAGSDATKALQMAGKALSLINVEFKHNDNTTSIANQTTSATVQNLFIPTQGDTDTNRNGDSVKVVSLQAKFDIYHNSSATNTITRIMLIQDKQTNGAVPNASDILSVTSVIGLRNVDWGKRFNVLFDRKVHTDSTNPIKFLKFYKKITVHMEFGGNAGSIADINKNSFIVLAISDEATNGPQINRATRIRFIDN